METSIIFPAFVNEYTGSEGKAISAFENSFISRLSGASDILGVDLRGFDFIENNFLDNEIKSQYISYIYSCSVADILKRENIRPLSVSGYSMGIYAALYYCGSIGFREGLMMVKSAWEVISAVTATGKYGMGMIIGLEESDILTIMYPSDNVEICNQNNRHTFIISGSSDAVESVLISAKTEGALRANIIPVTKPYHSQILKNTGPEFTKVISSYSIGPPVYRYISSIDQRVKETAEEIRNEVIKNMNNLDSYEKKYSDMYFCLGD